MNQVERANQIIQVAIVEDDADIRELLSLLIDKSPGYICKDRFSNAEDALEALPKADPDVVLMDVELPGIWGIEAVRKLKPQMENTDFIMLTIRVDDETIFEALRAGASGYLQKDTPPAQLLTGIRDAFEGGAPMSPYIARKVTAYFRPEKSNYNLTKREQEILQLLCDGQNYQSIAEQLFVSGHTVRAHIKNIYSKLHVSSRGEAVSKAHKDGLIK